MNIDLKNITLQVCELAREVGQYIANERKNLQHQHVETKGLHDLVSYVDKTAESKIINGLMHLVPNAGFIAEEGTQATIGERFNWIIDPLDGTTNFIHGIPIFAVSIALKYKNSIVSGVVFEIGQSECFYAWKNGGSWLNGSSISVSDCHTMQDALLATGFPYTDFSGIDTYIERLKWAMTHARGVRRLGSAATDLAYVACGRFDGFWEYSLKAWDVAAGSLLVAEAGGKVTDFEGGDNYLFGKTIIATNAFIDLCNYANEQT